MDKQLSIFERVVRSAPQFTFTTVEAPTGVEHPFETRNIHPCLPKIVRKLFDDSHYSQATFEVFKFVDKEVARLAKHSDSGFKLMMAVFSETTPLIKLTPCETTSEKDEQKGFQFLFAGSMLTIRNPSSLSGFFLNSRVIRCFRESSSGMA